MLAVVVVRVCQWQHLALSLLIVFFYGNCSSKIVIEHRIVLSTLLASKIALSSVIIGIFQF